MDAHHGVDVFLAEGAHQVVGAFLHLGVGALHGVELNAVGVAAGVDRRHGAAAQADAVVVAAHHHDFVAFLRLFLQAVALGAVAHAAGQHNHLVVGILLVVLLVLEGEHGTADERLAELVAEVGGSVGGLDENLLGCLVEPLAHGQDVLPRALGVAVPLVVGETRVGRHVDSGAGDGPGAYAAAHTVAYLAAGAGGGAVEGLHGGGEVVGLGLERDDALHLFHSEIVGGGLVFRGELLHDGALCERHIVFIGGENLVGILLGGFLDEGEERRLHLLAVDDEGAAENLVAAVLGVDLGEAEHLGVGEGTAQLGGHVVQIYYLFGRERQTLLLVESLQVVDLLDGLGLVVDGEDVLVEPFVHALQHGVIGGVFVGHGEVLLNACDAVHVHVLGYLYGVGAPRGDHLAAGTYEIALERLGLERGGLSIEPAQLALVFTTQHACLGGNDALRLCPEKIDHIVRLNLGVGVDKNGAAPYRLQSYEKSSGKRKEFILFFSRDGVTSVPAKVTKSRAENEKNVLFFSRGGVTF